MCYLLGEVGAWGEGVDRESLLLGRWDSLNSMSILYLNHNVTILYHKSQTEILIMYGHLEGLHMISVVNSFSSSISTVPEIAELLGTWARTISRRISTFGIAIGNWYSHISVVTLICLSLWTPYYWLQDNEKFLYFSYFVIGARVFFSTQN